MTVEQKTMNYFPRALRQPSIIYVRRDFQSHLFNAFSVRCLGVYSLESELRTDSRMFKFVFKNMSRGDMVLPENGISDCPNQLFQRLESTNLNLNADAEAVSENGLLVDGEQHSYDVIIQAFGFRNNPA